MLNYRGDNIDELVERNYPLFLYLVKKHNKSNFYTTTEDIVDYCLITYIKSCYRYDKNKNIKFSSYLSRSIQNKICNYYTRNSDFKYKTNEILSLNSTYSDGCTEQIELVEYPINKFSDQRKRIFINQTIEYLKRNFSLRDLQIFYRYINDENQKDIAKKFNISQVQVSRIIKRIRNQTKEYFGFDN